MVNNNESSSGGISFCSLLFLIFLTLKLCDIIDWSWWWVTAPLWGPALFALSIVIFACICAVLHELCKK